jgi:hypothetical protein
MIEPAVVDCHHRMKSVFDASWISDRWIFCSHHHRQKRESLALVSTLIEGVVQVVPVWMEFHRRMTT